jgi:L-threonylcarbamoyladenylate synthase
MSQAFWPGPLTVVLKVSPRVSRLCTAGLDSVGVRMPSHPVALALLRVAALPIAAPSANISGRPSPTTAKHVLDDLGARVAGVIDGGGAGVGLESTVVDCTGADQDAVLILRPGGVSRADLLRVVKRVELDPALARRAAASLAPDAAASAPARAPADEDSAAAAAALRPRAPGMKYVHYAPKAPVFLVRGDDALMAALARQRQARGERVGLLATEEAAAGALRGVSEFTVVCGRRSDLESVARGLYAALRAFDELGVDAILAPCLPLDGIGEAIMNRLEKAAAHRVLTAADLAPA